MPRVVHFELGTEQPERAVSFYQAVFGWEIEKWGDFDYWLITTGDGDEQGIDGALMVHQDAKPRTVNSIEVDSLDDAGDRIMQAGGALVTDKITIPGVGHTIYFRDTEGNLLGLHQTDPEAK
jgi:predicted enzyme related to lactoylglutathione lyase